MNRHHTRRRQHQAQTAGSMSFNPSAVFENMYGKQEETFEESEQKINSIITDVQTTRDDLQKELVIYEQKMTVLEKEFTQYQKLAMKVMSALDVIDNMTQKLTGQKSDASASDDEDSSKTSSSENASTPPNNNQGQQSSSN